MDPLKLSVGGGEVARPEPRPERVERPEAPAQAERPAQEHHEEQEESGSDFAREDSADRQAVAQSADHVVTYAVDQKTREVVAKVVDRESGEVVREVPSEQLRAMQKALKEVSKKLFDRMA